MKQSSIPLPAAAAALVCAAVLAATTIAQAPQPQPTPPGATPQGQAGGPPNGQPGGFQHREWPKPTNLQVLPKDLTGQQVRDIMEKWQGDLGVHCDTCHAADPNNVGPNGRPRLNFADDSKAEKKTARLMYKMTGDINDNYVSMVGEGKATVTCGTCHRGHQKPEAFIPPPEHRGPPPGQPGGQPPAGGQPPIPR